MHVFAEFLQVSGEIPKDWLSLCVLMVVESTVYHIGPKLSLLLIWVDFVDCKGLTIVVFILV